MKATFQKYILEFRQPGGTSRGILHQKETWLIQIQSENQFGIGECAMFKGLSYDDTPEYEDKLQWVCDHISLGLENLLGDLNNFPSIQFGLEMAFKSLSAKDDFILFPSAFTRDEVGIPINGLIWMGPKDLMLSQVKRKLEEGFKCIKLKIGAIDFLDELDILKSIRQDFSSQDIEIRVDANGAFSPSQALEKLEQLAQFDLHSIEQPIKPGQIDDMAMLCEKSPLPIALDEELIGIIEMAEKEKILDSIKPHYIILKPSLVGGYNGSEQWIHLAGKRNIGWWITSALESNIGLNAIAQWTHRLDNPMPQGLGTGGLFTNNFSSPLNVKNGTLRYAKNKSWNLNI